MTDVKHWIAGDRMAGERRIDVFNPATGDATADALVASLAGQAR